MKKTLKILIKLVAGLVLLILLLLLVTPVLFKKQIKEQVIKVANENIEAQFSFNDFGVSFFKHFPNFSFTLKEVYVVGIESFEEDTIAGFNSFSLVFDLSSLIGKKGYSVRSVIVNRPVIKAVVLADGSASWDIMKSSGDETPEDESETAPSSMKVKLRNFEIRDGVIWYNDYQSLMSAGFNNYNLKLSGNMSSAQSDILLSVDITGFNFTSDGIDYVKGASLSGRFDVGADLENNLFTLGENSISLNEILFSLSGVVAMQGESIETDLSFHTGETGFKELLSMVPAFYMKGYESLRADGTFGFSGTAKGIYNSSDSIYPDVDLELYVKDGVISYPDLPEKISDISVVFKASVAGSNPDESLFNLEKFHFSMAGNPFDLNFMLRTPISDPDMLGNARGKINLGSVSSAIPVEEMELSGIIDMGLAFNGRYSLIEDNRYDEFVANGSVTLSDISIAMDKMPPVSVSAAKFIFSPRFIALNGLSMDIAGSDIFLAGRIENYIAYVMKGETISGSMTLNSELIDAGKIMSFIPSDTIPNAEEVPLADIRVPGNIDFKFSSSIVKFLYPPLSASNIEANIIVRDGTIKIENAGLETLGGSVNLTALYDTRDSLNPIVKGSVKGSGIGIKPAFETFNTVQKLVPVAEGMSGDISVLFEFSSSLGKGMIPVTDSITGKGSIESEAIELISSPVYERFSTLFKLDESFSNQFKDVSVEFRVENGRVYIKPFNTKMGVVKMNIGGDHGLDQSLNYVVKTEMPTRYLPESMKTLMNSMAAQAALLGINYKQPETIKVNLAIGGTVKQPVILPALAGMGEGSSAATTLKENARQAVESVVDETKERASAELEKQAARIIAEAGEKADLVRSKAADAAQLIRDEAEKNAQKLINEAETKNAVARLAASKGADMLRREADKKASQLIEEADKQATAIVEEAKKRAAELGG
ncbi:MAG: AsmA family protein [Bacteroidia bacterium]|nr:MAG: AsmA family protein [Bacteroidia bacterium]